MKLAAARPTKSISFDFRKVNSGKKSPTCEIRCELGVFWLVFFFIRFSVCALALISIDDRRGEKCQRTFASYIILHDINCDLEGKLTDYLRCMCLRMVPVKRSVFLRRLLG